MTEGQLRWIELNGTSLAESRYDDVYFTDENHGWAVNYKGQVLITENGGEDWRIVTIDSNRYFRTVEFLNDSTGFIGSLDTAFYATHDGGNTWQRIDSLFPVTQPAYCGLSHFNRCIFAVGSWFQPGFFLKSNDAGQTWSYRNLDSLCSALIDCHFMDSVNGFATGRSSATGNPGIILKTSDGGDSWQVKHLTSTFNEYVWKVQFVSSDVGFASIESFNAADSAFILKTTDGGNTWTRLFVAKNVPDLQAIGFLNDTLGFSGGKFNGMYKTINGGSSWIYETTGDNLNRIYVINSKLAYAAGKSLYKYSDSFTAIHQPHRQENEKDVLKITGAKPMSIEAEIDCRTYMSLEIYDLSGKRVEVLQSGIYSQGSYSFSWDSRKYEEHFLIVSLRTSYGFFSEKVFIAPP